MADTRPECVVLIGLPGAGKTTFYRQRYPAHDHISKDTIPNSANKQARQDAALRRALAAGRPVIVDNTNVSPADRAAVIAIAREFDARVVGYYIEAATRDAVARNEGRTGRAKVPKVAIFTAAKRLVPPSASEGFDELHTVRALADGGFG
ncbi:MAG TPA: ATP-binding protein [Vicinamibacterales bacterium]|nr:ATP-binding protein [Vicinamibacterales bacterium]